MKSSSPAVLFLLPDCPGYYTELCYQSGKNLQLNGYSVIFASTSPFYEKFKNINLAEVGDVYYLNDFLDQDIPETQYNNLPLDNWSNYASFSRQTYFFGRPLNSSQTLRKTKLFFERIFRAHNVELLISEGVSNSFLYMAFEQAKLRGIPYFGWMGARLPYQFNVHVDVTGNEVLVNTKAPAEYVASGEVPDYMKNSQFGGAFDREYSMLSMKFVKEIVQFLLLKNYRSLETGKAKHFLMKVYQIAFRRILADFYYRKIVRLFSPSVEFSAEKITVIYPLHFYPEASTSIYARHYDGNEFNVIKNIAFSLPDNAVLVVKEHKANVGNNNKRFYEKIKQLPNTILLDPYYKLLDNLSNFDAVVTLSSTVGFEALSMNIPTFVIGEVFYQRYPGAIKLDGYNDFGRLGNIKKRDRAVVKSETFNIYSKICFPGSFNYMSPTCVHDENVSLLLAPVFDYLRTKKMSIHHNDKP